jgi:hypothetical protein
MMARVQPVEMDVDQPGQAFPQQDRAALETELDQKYEAFWNWWITLLTV